MLAYVRGDNMDHEKGLPWTMPTNITRKSAQGFVGHKIGHTATGCAGTVSYLIGNTNKLVTLKPHKVYFKLTLPM